MATSTAPTPDELLRFVVAKLREIAPDAPTAGITIESSFTDLEIESVTVIELIALIEDDLGVSLPDDDLASIDTIRQLVACISHQIADV